jgi:aminopeptidase N
VVATAEHDDGTRTLLAVGGPIRDFYIAMSADYRVVSQQVDGTRVNSYYLPGQEEGGAEALRYASESLHLFSQEFGAYPYAELDVVATPTSAGGIEYPGVIAIASSFYGDPDYYYFGVVVTHEVAHQWWHGLVGSDQLDEPWMDEALTNYSMYLYYEGTAGRDQANVIKEKVFKEPYRTAQQEFRDREVGGPVSSFSQEDYVTIVYGKGPLFFDAVRAQVGDAAFFAALQTYLARHRYRVAYPEDLIAAFEDASGQQIDDLYRSWIEGKAE